MGGYSVLGPERSLTFAVAYPCIANAANTGVADAASRPEADDGS